jgi:cell wall-associated NlpC family hydrolase
VQTWVRNAEAGNDGLSVVSADQARPGDIVAYDWGGQEDFGSDGHIGFLASNVKDGKFTALEGNNHDAVSQVPRQMGQANIKFIHIDGAGTPPAGAPPVVPAVSPDAAPAPPAAIETGAPSGQAPAPAAVPAAAAAPAGNAIPHVDPGTAGGVKGDVSGIAAVDAALASSNGGEGAKALAAITEAKKFMGTPYHWGGSTPQTGFDCSGLMQWAYAQAGVKLPRVTYDQIHVGTAVAESDLKPGDLIFFGDPGAPHHVAMSLGGDKFIHAPQTGENVKVSSLNEPYFKSQFAGARRVDMSAPAAGGAAPVAPTAGAVAGQPVASAAAVPGQPAVDPAAVAHAQAAVARDAAEVRRQDSMLFMAVKAQEASKHRATVMFMKAIDPNQAKAAAAAPAAGAGPAAAASAAAPPDASAAAAPAPGAASDASMNQAVGAPVPANELMLQNVGPIGDYPGDTASKAQLAQWLASEAKKAGLPPELPVMASLVESGVKNIQGGDADSAGFFQMRVGIWDQGPYKGFRQDPHLQAKWFIDEALAVKHKAIASGDVNFGKDPSKFGDWIADIERPAAQYRYRYGLRLGEARGLLGGG